jgi:hypothetical protein
LHQAPDGTSSSFLALADGVSVQSLASAGQELEITLELSPAVAHTMGLAETVVASTSIEHLIALSNDVLGVPAAERERVELEQLTRLAAR